MDLHGQDCRETSEACFMKYEEKIFRPSRTPGYYQINFVEIKFWKYVDVPESFVNDTFE